MNDDASDAPRRAIVVFHGESCGFWPWLCGRPGFRHCFVALDDGRAWIEVDPRGDGIGVAAEVPAAVDLASHYRALGYAVIETALRRRRRRYRVAWAFTCVEAVKRVLGVHGWLIWTPYQLYRQLEKDEMGSIFNPPKPKAPPPPPPPPEPDDPAIEDTRKREREAARRRRGRQATILTSGLGDTGTPQVQQPTLLG
ncbi:MAG: hypothetical protein ACFCUT_09150 [Kiloniellaceae bacterium]